MPPKRRQSLIFGAKAIIYENGKVLIQQRKLDDSAPGRWEFPGGGIDAQETAEVCIVRECEEELGIKVEVQKHLGSRQGNLFSGRGQIKLDYFLIRRVAGEPQALESIQIKWVDIEELPKYELGSLDTEMSMSFVQGVVKFE